MVCPAEGRREMVEKMTVTNILGILILAVVFAIVMSILGADAYKGLGAKKGILMFVLLTVILFVLGIGVWFGVVMVAS